MIKGYNNMPAARPNILWIQTDEHRTDSLGCYGSAWARTPNIDRLAESGTLFSVAMCQSPVCTPSRASQLTARYPQEINTLFNDVAEDPFARAGRPTRQAAVFPVGTITFPELLSQQADYETASFGKTHTPLHPTWQELRPLVLDTTYAGYYELNESFSEANYRIVKRPGSTPIILGGTYPSNLTNPSKTITDWAIDWIARRQSSTRPFLLRVSHNWPHTPVLPPPPYDRCYAADDLPIRLFDETAYRTRSAWDRKLADAHRMRDLTEEQYRQQWTDYMGLCAYIDFEVGRLLTAIEQRSTNRPTMVIFSADHGKMLGEWGAAEKGTFDDTSWRVPFIWSCPGLIPEGVIRTDPCELIDTARTLAGLVGAEPVSHWRGRDLFRAPFPMDNAVFGQIGWPTSSSPSTRLERDGNSIDGGQWQGLRVAIRTERYRLDEHWMRDGLVIDTANAQGNLFDLKKDPDERQNVWSMPEYAEVETLLRQQLWGWLSTLERPQATFNGEVA